MNPCRIVLILVAGLSVANVAAAIDTVKKKDKQNVLGRISAMDSKKVVVTKGSAKIRVPAGQIQMIVYGGEPSSLSLARSNIGHGRYEDALKTLHGIDISGIKRKWIVADIEFYKAICAAQLALRGEGDVAQAGSQMVQFASTHNDSYHWLDANQLIGDLLVANRRYGSAINYYTRLAEAPSLDYRLRATVGIGQAQLAAGKIDEALASFEKAIGMESADAEQNNAQVGDQRKLAQIGKARCLAAKDQLDDALKLLHEVIDQSNPKKVVLGARAYNALGTALRRAGKPYDALLAFLHVDVLYFTSPEDHAEALFNLAGLWQEVHKTDRAIRAQETLKKRYKNSRWASQ